MRSPVSVIGASVPRAEGPDKMTGRAIYAADLSLPGILWGKILRSPFPHARIARIDASRAWEVPGVRAVLTGQDVVGRFMGKVLRDMPVLCWDRVRFIGDRVAAVAAETAEAAEAALDLIAVEYEELPAVFDPLEAMRPEAPRVHQDVASYDGAPLHLLATDVPNGQTRLAWRKGNVEQGFREADLVLEHTFRIPSRHQGYLEPYASVVAIDPTGRVQAWASTKAPFRTRIQLAKAVGIAEEDILVNPVFVGGDFGGKGDARDLPIAYLLARQAGRPVRIVMTYQEELTASNPSHPTVVTIRSGLNRDGRILARSVRTIHASGAYGALKPNAALSTWHYVGGPYRVEHAAFEFLQVYTHTVPGGYFRAPGAHQFTFALECHTDLIANQLRLDPAEFRLRNLIADGEQDAVGKHVARIRAREVLEGALAASNWTAGGGRDEHWGRGVALFGRQIGGGLAAAVLIAERDGRLTVLSPTIDQGVGTHTIVQQLVAEELQVPLEAVRVVVGNTDEVPFDEGPRASRVTYTEGRAVIQACRELRERLLAAVAQLADCRSDEVELRDGAFWNGARRFGLAEAVGRAGQGEPVRITVQIEAPQPEDVTYFSAQVAEVKVDPTTGQVRLERLITAHDVGTIINPVTHQGQIDGGAVTGIGLALTEELSMEEGRITTQHLGDYKLPTMADLPVLETVLVPSPGIGPHAAGAIGELANNATPAAIANAVADAVGARLYELPITAERVYDALRRAEDRPE